MCRAHVDRNVDKNMKIKNKALSEEMKSDLFLLQGSHSKEFFHHYYKLFWNKWDSKELSVDDKNDVAVFMKYFHDTWVNSINNGWYEGVAIRVPSHNNGLEGTNGLIKDAHTFHERLGFGQYLSNLSKMVKNWSINRERDIFLNLHNNPYKYQFNFL